ncbi:MAG: TIGR00282 family metallophosphoesterase [Armatimonadetes bacterium]|nr:TIGR00282 family metallophosphoesterase [Armatimonadota bacterium]
MRILFLSDVVGRPGRNILAARLPALISELDADFVIVNCENAAAGYGITRATAQELFDCGAHVLTSGNHIWAQKEATALLDEEARLLRPANYPPGAPGRGHAIFHDGAGTPVAVVNLQGRVFMDPIECPFRTADSLLTDIGGKAAIILVDFHAEATSEKQALGWYLDGRVTAVIGTHTHVQTADERILPGGTAYLSDAGFCGALDSVIGVDKDIAVGRFLSGIPTRFQVPKRSRGVVQGALVEANENTGHASAIIRISLAEQGEIE